MKVAPVGTRRTSRLTIWEVEGGEKSEAALQKNLVNLPACLYLLHT